MSVAKVIEITAQSSDGFEAAIAEGIAKASESVKNIRHAWVKDHEVHISDGKVTTWRVSLKITFLVE
ncbi:MAG: dodecin family protein [Acidimicrobiia bacterium]|jgi:flavin-binding protein dodecin